MAESFSPKPEKNESFNLYISPASRFESLTLRLSLNEVNVLIVVSISSGILRASAVNRLYLLSFLDFTNLHRPQIIEEGDPPSHESIRDEKVLGFTDPPFSI